MASDTHMDPMDLKVKELLKEAQLDYSPATTKRIDDVVSSIKEAINKIPEDLKVTADVAPGFVRDIGADKVDFKFKKPKSIEIGGSYSYRCVAKPDVNIDLFVRLPKECFLEKDYLNYRYHAKRFLYLCIMKKYLKYSSFAQKVEWCTFQNEARKPILVVYPAMELFDIPGFSIRIIPTATSLFSVSKLKLERHNLRGLYQVSERPQDGVLQATPMYNSSILEDMFVEDHAEFIGKTFSGWKELGEALVLLKVWARQRSSIYAHDCLSGYLISVIMAHLATKAGRNNINNSMSVMEIFRVTLTFIATSKSWADGLFIKPRGKKVISKEKRTYDSFADFNMAFRVSKTASLELADEATLALRCIDTCNDGGFDEIFMTKVDFPAKFDYCVRLNLRGNAEIYASGFCLDDECWRLYEQKVLSLVQRGLGDRVKFVRVMWRNCASECNIEEGLSMFDREPVLIGVSISSIKEAFKELVVGPVAENKDEALEFQKFWGDKAELRVLRDTIRECTYWQCDPMEKHLIMKRITEYVLLRHLALSKENIMHVVDQLDFSLLQANKDPTSSVKSLLDAFDVLSKRLRVLNDIPLKISSVQPLDSAFRCTSVCPPQSHPLAYESSVGMRIKKLGPAPACIQPLEVMIQLEGSGNWPMDDVAIEKTKSAFLLRIGESLQKQWGMSFTATEDDVDVFLSGYAFRLRILHERSLSLSKRQSGSDPVKRVSSTDKDLFIRGQHSSMINGLRGSYPLYGPVTRLAKRWVAAHLFSSSLAEEAIEFLRLLSDYDWTYSALIVDINGDLTKDDEKGINENFLSSRKAYGEDASNVNPAMFLATSYDKASEVWTRSSPSSSELRRLAAYARSSSNLLTKLILHDQLDSFRWECLFRTPLNNYDAVILLHRDKLPYPQRLLFPSELNQGRQVVRGNASKTFSPFISCGNTKGSLEELKDRLLVDFEPLRCFIEELEKEFPDMFKLWYDSLGGDAIGLTWGRNGLKVFNRSSYFLLLQTHDGLNPDPPVFLPCQKRGRVDIGEEEREVLDALKTVGEIGKGFVRSVHLLKAPRLE
ncbi:hypothetical protein RJ639_007835 [Escallonia herrerae]|uniref:Nucleolar protein 6 n=1 Tax=Escallonia herrerae TaxID=1293975 RepID=A0AA89AVV5_9ASTE|nr:hypothetical protein RJ639_007835 [Escallonia herrerae]